jgi:hypothetical protein
MSLFDFKFEREREGEGEGEREGETFLPFLYLLRGSNQSFQFVVNVRLHMNRFA